MKFKKTIPIVISIMTCSIIAPLVVSCNQGETIVSTATIKVNSLHGEVKLSVDGADLKETNYKIEVGKTLKVEVTPNEGYKVKTVTLGSNIKNETNVAEFVIEDSGELILNVTYEKIEVTEVAKIKILNSEFGTIEVKNIDLNLNNVPLNTKIELQVTPNKGYSIKNVKVNEEDISNTLSFTIQENIEYVVSAEFNKDKVASLGTIEVNKISGNTGSSLSLTPSDFTTTNIEISGVESSYCYNEEGKIRVSSGNNGGSITFNLDKKYLITSVKLYAENYHSDSCNIKLSIGDETISKPLEEVLTYNISYPLEVNKFTFSSSPKNRFIINKIEVEINGEGEGEDTSPTDKEATIKVTKTGQGEVKLEKDKGFEGENVKANIIPATNYYIDTIKFNDSYIWLKPQTDYVNLTLKAGVNNLDVVFKEGEQGGTPSDFSYLYGNDRIKPTRGSLGSYDAYYEPVRGLKGPALKEGLNKIIKGHKTFSYSSLNDAMKVTDVDPFNSSNLIFTYEGSLSKGNSFNKEHTWAKSVGDFGTGQGPGSDMHHLRPSHTNLNSTRSNFDFATVTGGKDCGTAFSWSRPSMKGNFVGGQKFEPKDEFKGDVARMIFYMATRYEGDDGYLDLEVGSSKGSISGIDPNKYYTFGTGKGTHGCFNDLYKWATTSIDPVSDFEVNRNNLIDEKYQHNRNPFIDHPEFIIMIYDKNYNGPGALNDK